jgi:tetratricopeptide (TPR) repeat protein
MLKSAVPRAPEPAPGPVAPASPTIPPPFEPRATGSIALDTSPAPTSIQDWYNKAKILYDTKCHQEALGYIQYALKLETEKYDYHVLHSKILEALGSDKRAMVTALENCLRLNNKDADSAIKLAETYQGIGMYARATRYWEWAANLAPDHPYFQKQKASTKERAQETAEGIGGQFRLWVDQAKDALGKFTKR